MTTERSAQFSFTKLVVDDLDAMADFYCSVFDLHRATRLNVEDGVGGEPIEEIILGATPEDQWGSLILLKFRNRPLAKEDEVILGFTTTDLDGLLDRFTRRGGSILSPIKEMPEHGIRVAFARDPEGHLSELVEPLG